MQSARQIDLKKKNGRGICKVLKILWNTRVTPKTQILGWRVFLDKLPTKDNLLKRGSSYNIVFATCVMHTKKLQSIYLSHVRCPKWCGICATGGWG